MNLRKRGFAAVALGALVLAVNVRAAAMVGPLPGAVVVFPYLAADPETGTDTVLTMANDTNVDARARCLLWRLDAICRGGDSAGASCNDGPEACGDDGTCYRAGSIVGDFEVGLVSRQPLQWRLAQGLDVSELPMPVSFPPNLGTSIPAAPAEPFVGALFCYSIAVDGTPVEANAFSGTATITRFEAGQTFEAVRYAAITLRAFAEANDGDLRLNLGDASSEGAEYEGCPNILQLSHAMDGAPHPIAEGGRSFTRIVLLPCSLNLNGFARTDLTLLAVDEFGQRLTARRTVDGFLAARLSEIDPYLFDAATRGALRGNIRVQGSQTLLGLAFEEIQIAQATKSAAIELTGIGTRPQVDVVDLVEGETRCGNGRVEAPETCDDGNQEDGDCCAADCTIDAAGVACTDDDNACTVDACDADGVCGHALADPLPADCGCCQISLFEPSGDAERCVGDCNLDGAVDASEVSLCLEGNCTACNYGIFNAALAQENADSGCRTGADLCAAVVDAITCFSGGGTLVPGADCNPNAAGADTYGCAPFGAPTRTATPERTATPTPPACDGDFDGDAQVTVDEIVRAVGNALTGCSPDTCDGDFDGDGQVTVDEIVKMVRHALDGCPR